MVIAAYYGLADKVKSHDNISGDLILGPALQSKIFLLCYFFPEAPSLLTLEPPINTGRFMVLSIDEKSQIQALDRIQPGLTMNKGRGATMTHDYKRNGTTALFAALNVLDGTVIGHNMHRHRHQEFIRFLNQI